MAANYVRRRRLREEKGNKIWRNGRWLAAYTKDFRSSVSTSSSDILKMISAASSKQDYLDCSAVLNGLREETVASIISQLSVVRLHDQLPDSLFILEVLYKKIFYRSDREILAGQLLSDQLVKKLISLFAHQMATKKTLINVYRRQCRTILFIIASTDDQFQSKILYRKKALDRCLKNMGKHGHVSNRDGKLGTLYEALKSDLDTLMLETKVALQKLETLMIHKKHSGDSLKPKSSQEASHYRLLQVDHDSVMQRLYDNKSLLNLLEPIMADTHLRKCVTILNRRTEYDKVLLFHESELKKMCVHEFTIETSMAETLNYFSQGYGVLLSILAEPEKTTTVQFSDYFSSGEDDVISTLRLVKRKADIPLKAVNQIQGHLPNDSERWSHTSDLRGPSRSDEAGQHGGPRATLVRPAVGLRHENKPNVSFSLRTQSNNRSIQMESNSNALQQSQEDRISLLQQEVQFLNDELARSRDQITQLQSQEKQLRDRLATQAQSQFTLKSGHVFEDLNLGAKRPTSLIAAYHDLYRDGRVDTLDALDEMPELHSLDVLKMKILFTVIVLSFRCVQQTLVDLKIKLRHLLCLPSQEANQKAVDPVCAEMEHHISQYLVKSADTYNLSAIIQEVSESISGTLYEYPGLRSCRKLREYTEMAVRIAWGLSVQSPPYVIVYESSHFQPQYHIRFHTSNSDMDDIKSVLWPCLVDGHSSECVARGVVIT